MIKTKKNKYFRKNNKHSKRNKHNKNKTRKIQVGGGDAPKRPLPPIPTATVTHTPATVTHTPATGVAHTPAATVIHTPAATVTHTPVAGVAEGTHTQGETVKTAMHTPVAEAATVTHTPAATTTHTPTATETTTHTSATGVAEGDKPVTPVTPPVVAGAEAEAAKKSVATPAAGGEAEAATVTPPAVAGVAEGAKKSVATVTPPAVAGAEAEATKKPVATPATSHGTSSGASSGHQSQQGFTSLKNTELNDKLSPKALKNLNKVISNTKLTDAQIAQLVKEARENAALDEKGNVYISSWVKGILGHIAFLFPNGRELYAKGLGSNAAVENAEILNGQLQGLQKLYTNDITMSAEELKMLLFEKEKIIRQIQQIQDDSNNIPYNSGVSVMSGGTTETSDTSESSNNEPISPREKLNINLESVNNAIKNTTSRIQDSRNRLANLATGVDSAMDAVKTGTLKVEDLDAENMMGSGQGQQNKPKTILQSIREKYQKFKSDRAAKKAEKDAAKQGKNPPPGQNPPPPGQQIPPGAAEAAEAAAGHPPPGAAEAAAAAGHPPAAAAAAAAKPAEAAAAAKPAEAAAAKPSTPAGPSRFTQLASKAGAAFKGLFSRKKGGGGYTTPQNGGARNGNNNKTRKNREYIHEIKENRKQLFDKEMEIINSIRNFKHEQHGQNHNKHENIKKEFIKVIKRK